MSSPSSGQPGEDDGGGGGGENENDDILFIDEGVDRTVEVYRAKSKSVFGMGAAGGEVALTPVPLGSVGTPQRIGVKRSRKVVLESERFVLGETPPDPPVRAPPAHRRR